MTKEELGLLLKEAKIQPWRGRSQNFLLDDDVIRKTVAASGAGPGDAVVEIGPGLGVLTAGLLAAGARVAAVEIDRRLVEFLRRRFDRQDLRIIEGDVLEFSNSVLCEACGGAAGSYRVVANLPYSITSRVIQKFLLEDPKPRSLTIMIQREVANRLLARPGDMSSLAVLAQTCGRVNKVADVLRTCFFPVPRVDSAVIHIEIRDRRGLDNLLDGVDEGSVFKVAAAAFSQKRKQIKNSLLGIFKSEIRLNQAIIQANLRPEQRPEELDVRDWIALARALSN